MKYFLFQSCTISKQTAALLLRTLRSCRPVSLSQLLLSDSIYIVTRGYNYKLECGGQVCTCTTTYQLFRYFPPQHSSKIQPEAMSVLSYDAGSSIPDKLTELSVNLHFVTQMSVTPFANTGLGYNAKQHLSKSNNKITLLYPTFAPQKGALNL